MASIVVWKEEFKARHFAHFGAGCPVWGRQSCVNAGAWFDAAVFMLQRFNLLFYCVVVKAIALLHNEINLQRRTNSTNDFVR
jgi:hypothetical protein